MSACLGTDSLCYCIHHYAIVMCYVNVVVNVWSRCCNNALMGHCLLVEIVLYFVCLFVLFSGREC